MSNFSWHLKEAITLLLSLFLTATLTGQSFSADVTSLSCSSTESRDFRGLLSISGPDLCGGWTAPRLGITTARDYTDFQTFRAPGILEFFTFTVFCADNPDVFETITVRNPCFESTICEITTEEINSTCITTAAGNKLIFAEVYIDRTSPGLFSTLGNTAFYGDTITVGPMPTYFADPWTISVFDLADPSFCRTSFEPTNNCLPPDADFCDNRLSFIDTTHTACGTANGSIVIATVEDQGAYELQWIGPEGTSGSVSNTGTVTNLSPGVYFFEQIATDGTCLGRMRYIVEATTHRSVNFEVTGDCEDRTITARVQGDPPNLIYQWSTSEQSQSIVNNGGGTFSLSIIDTVTACPRSFHTLTLPHYQPTTDELAECSTVSGFIFYDENEDCFPSPGEQRFILAAIVRLQNTDTNSEYFTTSFGAGDWVIELPDGDYLAEFLPPNEQFSTCTPVAFTVSNGSATAIGLPAIVEDLCPRVEVEANFLTTRRCGESYITVSATNNGTTSAEMVEISVTLGPWVDSLDFSFTITPDGQTLDPVTGELTLTYLIDNLAIGETFNQLLRVYSCNEAYPLGSAVCVTTTVIAANDCPLTLDPWSGASITAGITCEGDSIRFEISNEGIANMTMPLNYVVVEDGVILLQEQTSPLPLGESAIFSLPANGKTYHLLADQEPFHPASDQVSAFLENCNPGPGFSSFGFALQIGPYDGEYYRDRECAILRASHDPNNKLAEPRGFGEEHFIEPNLSIDYTINFQNVGNDTAYTVRIEDTISPLLDLSTFQFLSATHPVALSLDTNRLLTFTFTNIDLVDSLTNAAGSQGFVRYRIDLAQNAEIGDRIENTAAIFFDNNPAIVTNTYWHTLGAKFLRTSSVTNAFTTNFKVYPNPASGYLFVQLESGYQDEIVTLELFDNLGRSILKRFGIGAGFRIDIGHLPSGYYVARMSHGGRHLSASKVIISKN